MLNVLDEKWKDHLYDLDQLRNAIHYRSWGQKDPLLEYKSEAYTMFVDLMHDVHHTFAERFLRVQVVFDQPPPAPPPSTARRKFNALGVAEDSRDQQEPGSVATLDVVSGGRVLLGVGAGWLAEEFTALGLDPKRRFSRTEECIEVLRALWTEPEPSYHGRHFDFEPVHFAPRPVSDPHPPIILGGDSDRALARAARMGDGWMSGGVATDVAEIEERVTKVRALREQYGATGPFEITILFRRPTVDDLARLEGAGVDRVVVMPWNRSREAITALEAFADTAIRNA